MEQALQELQGNELQQRKRDLSPEKLTAAPLLRKWHKQKLQAQARQAFERDFLPGPAAAGQHRLPSFVAVAEASQPAEAGAQQRPSSPTHRSAAAADRALKLVKELERQRRAEASTAAAEQQQQQRQRQQQQAAARAAPASSAMSSEECDVTVDDLISFIPPVSAVDSQQPQQAGTRAPDDTLAAAARAAVAAARAAGAAAASDLTSSLSEGVTELLGDSQRASLASSLQQSTQGMHTQDSMDAALGSSVAESAATAVDSAAIAAGTAGGVPSELQTPSSLEASSSAAFASAQAGAGSDSIGQLSSQDSGGAGVTAAQGDARQAPAVPGSRDSIDDIIAAADEVLRQLPADMQAAAAARAAAAAAPTPRPSGSVASPSQPQHSSQEPLAGPLQAPVGSNVGMRSSVQQQMDRSRLSGSVARPMDSSAEAGAILAELRALQQQLGVQVRVQYTLLAAQCVGRSARCDCVCWVLSGHFCEHQRRARGSNKLLPEQP